MCARPVDAAITGQIAGTVVDVKTHQPLAGVVVGAVSPSGTYHATTDEKGTFSIVGVVPDTYQVTFDLPKYEPLSQAGVNVVADSPQTLTITLSKEPLTIVNTKSKFNRSSAAQLKQTENSYTVGSTAIEQLQGKANDTDEKSLLSKLPSVTLNNTGTVFIRGGSDFQVGYQLEGIDLRTPNSTLQNKSENVGNFDLLNGISSAQLIPGGGDASHGDSGTGLVSLQAKRGTYPAFGSIDLEAVSFPFDHQFSAEYGGATRSGSFSYYVGFTGVRESYQYGQPGTPGADLGIYTDSTSLNSINGANAVGVISTAADQQSNDLIGNFFFKFGKQQNQYLQFFYQNQIVRQGENYNGIGGLNYASGSPTGSYLFGNSYFPAALTGTDPELQALVPLYPGQTSFNQTVGSEDAIYSPFEVFKLEYGNNLNSSTYFVSRFYRTFSDQIENRPSIGIFNPQNGGTRTAFNLELDKQLGKHYIQVGGQYEFVDPYGTLEDFANYEYGYFGVAGDISANGPAPSKALCIQAGGCLPNAPIVDDFLSASSADCNVPGAPPGTAAFSGIAINLPNSTLNSPQNVRSNVPCGYLSQYFPNGTPRLPQEVESPETKQQVYGYYVQDRFSLGAKAIVQAGLRLDGYNFLFPNDPQNPPSIATVSHQRLFEPHLGITRQLTLRDSIRATYGRTLAVPLPGLSGNSIVRSTFNAYNKIPSYDNLTGAPATYCGLGLNQTCTSYADQLFWIIRDVRFPNTDIAPVRGSTFTNYDFTYSHAFGNGLSLSVTPFYRRGYDIVEQSTTLSFTAGLNPIPILRPAAESNLGVQKATGAEALVTYDPSPSLSFRFSGTYLNQLGNDPPLNYLSTAALELGTLYRSQLFSPFQGTLAATFTKGILRVNPVFTYTAGYPYGVGSVVQVFLPNGKPANVPNTNISSGVAGNTPQCYVDPQYSGTLTNPNIASCTGSPETASAGGILSKPNLNLDLSILLHAPGSRNTFGVKFTNLFDQLYGIPVVNPYFNNLIATGVYGPGSGHTGTVTNPNQNLGLNGAPSIFPAYDYGSYPYLLFPNRPPLETRVFYQVQL